MKELDKNKIYDLSELTSEELQEVLTWLKKNDEDWQEVELEDFSNKLDNYRLKYYNRKKEWNWTRENSTHNAKELFYTLENVQVDCRELTEEQIENMKQVVVKNYIDVSDCILDEFNYFFRINCPTYCRKFNTYTLSEEKTTITYDKFMELFAPQYEVTMIAEKPKHPLTPVIEKPKQYQVEIDTFTRCESNMTKEEILTCCKFNIDKYNWRNKGQDLEDLEKIISYANWAIKQLKQQ